MLAVEMLKTMLCVVLGGVPFFVKAFCESLRAWDCGYLPRYLNFKLDTNDDDHSVDHRIIKTRFESMSDSPPLRYLVTVVSCFHESALGGGGRGDVIDAEGVDRACPDCEVMGAHMEPTGSVWLKSSACSGVGRLSKTD